MKLMRPFLIIFLVICTGVVLHLGVTLILKWYMVHKINETGKYQAKLDDLDFPWWKGELKLQGLSLKGVDPTTQGTYLRINEVGGDLAFGPFFKNFSGNLLLNVWVHTPHVEVNWQELQHRQKVEPKKPIAIDQIQKKIKELPAFRIEKLTLDDGHIVIQNLGVSQSGAVSLDDFIFELTGFTNSLEMSDNYMANFQLSGNMMKSGDFKANGKFNWADDPLTFDVNGSLEGIKLPKLNPLFNQFAGIDIEGGTYQVYFELASVDGKVEGYFKPLIKGLNVVDLEKDLKEGIGETIVEGVVGAVAEILENQPKDQQGTKVPIKGKLKNLNFDLSETIRNVFIHAFISPLRPQVEGSINLQKLRQK